MKVISWIISHQHAVRMLKKLNTKKWQAEGFYVEYEEVGNLHEHIRRQGVILRSTREGPVVLATHKERVIGKSIYADYPASTEGGILTVYRDKRAIEEPAQDTPPGLSFNKGQVSFAEAGEYYAARQELGKWLNEESARPVNKVAIARLVYLYDLVLGGQAS